jgi:hypothetical protein
MAITFPFLTIYDPPGTSEGTLDPLGLYQIADQLAVQLVPAVRERMQRIRFLTAMAVGAIVTEGLEDDVRQRDASPHLVWEWLLVEALMRTRGDDASIWGVPGTLMARRALQQLGYLDARSYLKTPRIFGFHGVYKRLATYLKLVDTYLGPGPNAEPLVDAWARDQGFGGMQGVRPKLIRWASAIRRSMDERPPRTKPGWKYEDWDELAGLFAPEACKGRERRYLRDLLLVANTRQLGALPAIWQLLSEFDDTSFSEESLHHRLEKCTPEYSSLLIAIRAYEAFARSMQDAFDVLKAEAAHQDMQGFASLEIARDHDFKKSVAGLHRRFQSTAQALAGVNMAQLSIQNLFTERFGRFAESMDAGACAVALCAHHETVQRSKSSEGKRPWFDRLGEARIYIRQAYREKRRQLQPEHYVHAYRGWPIRRFYRDLS